MRIVLASCQAPEFAHRGAQPQTRYGRCGLKCKPIEQEPDRHETDQASFRDQLDDAVTVKLNLLVDHAPPASQGRQRRREESPPLLLAHA